MTNGHCGADGRLAQLVVVLSLDYVHEKGIAKGNTNGHAWDQTIKLENVLQLNYAQRLVSMKPR